MSKTLALQSRLSIFTQTICNYINFYSIDQNKKRIYSQYTLINPFPEHEKDNFNPKIKQMGTYTSKTHPREHDTIEKNNTLTSRTPISPMKIASKFLNQRKISQERSVICKATWC